ncbi:ATP-binding cassette domain-containing protein [Saxibacter everestensis]|uniref:ATP-binding cassette domain-containing protein n=1 Tax=Saxibacter everestensis TaxID=2909229 RepID=A0ABY8QVC8_9MICO|nr:ATP-binding cassette domain-containing protein [Brevibacteriaceae bacterium ZFBP1038]
MTTNLSPEAPKLTKAPPSLGAGRSRAKRSNLIGFGILLVVIVVIPFVVTPSLMNIAVFTLIFALPAIGLNLLMGLAGQVSLGQAAFFAVGAYTHGILLTKYDVPGPLAALIAVVVAMLIALLVGLPLMRLRGHYLALATLGLGFIVMIAVRESEFTGRTTGIYGIERPEVFGLVISSNGLFFWFVAPFVIVALILALNLSRSRAGRALSAVNDSELAAECLGVSTYALRLKVLVVSAGLAGLGGVFYAYQVTIVSPEIANFHYSVEMLLMVVIGGLGSVWGALAGAFVVELLGEGLRDVIPLLIPNASGEVQLVGYGLVLIIVIILLPGGLHQAVTSLLKRRRSGADGGSGAKNSRRPAAATGSTSTGATSGATSPDDPGATSGAASGATSPDDPGATSPDAASTPKHAESADADADIASSLPTISTPLEPGEVILRISDLSKQYGGVTAVDHVSFDVPAGRILGLIGPNGAGKTTCFNMISGALAPTTGEVTFLGQTISGHKPHIAANRGLTRTFQNLQVFSSTDVLGNVYMGRYRLGRAGIVRGMLGLQGSEQRAHRDTATSILDAMRLGDVAGTEAASLPFGRQRMMEVCRALAAEPALLLLDEPMAGLSGHERDMLAGLLRSLRDAGLTIVLVEHDVAQVMSLADSVAVLDDGVLIAHGDPESVRNDPKVMKAYLGTDNVDEARSELEELS